MLDSDDRVGAGLGVVFSCHSLVELPTHGGFHDTEITSLSPGPILIDFIMSTERY